MSRIQTGRFQGFFELMQNLLIYTDKSFSGFNEQRNSGQHFGPPDINDLDEVVVF